ncbi:MAG: hypothetical protein HS116_00130 [Planctomycetes bacterium]|nr:hypothetical protein [Planctomycetota bacterium]
MNSPGTDLNDIAEDVSLIIVEHAREGVCLDCSFSPENLYIEADAEVLHQVLDQLIAYAIQAVFHRRKGAERFRCIELRSGRRRVRWGTVFVEIAFAGPALTEEVKRDIRQPFMIPREEAAGCVLLRIREQIECMGGRFQIESPRTDLGHGVRFRMLFPDGRHRQ